MLRAPQLNFFARTDFVSVWAGQRRSSSEAQEKCFLHPAASSEQTAVGYCSETILSRLQQGAYVLCPHSLTGWACCFVHQPKVRQNGLQQNAAADVSMASSRSISQAIFSMLIAEECYPQQAHPERQEHADWQSLQQVACLGCWHPAGGQSDMIRAVRDVNAADE